MNGSRSQRRKSPRQSNLSFQTVAADMVCLIFGPTTTAHSAFSAWRTPSEFAFTFDWRRDLVLFYAQSAAPVPVASTAQHGTPTARSAR
jgi:hypothetical protein